MFLFAAILHAALLALVWTGSYSLSALLHVLAAAGSLWLLAQAITGISMLG